jgi:hypothetical protein
VRLIDWEAEGSWDGVWWMAGICMECYARGFPVARLSWDLDHASRLMRLCLGKAIRSLLVWSWGSVKEAAVLWVEVEERLGSGLNRYLCWRHVGEVLVDELVSDSEWNSSAAEE